MSNIMEFVLQFFLSGFVVIGATLLAKYVDAKWAGLLVALPVMTLLALLFVTLHTDTLTTQKYLLSALLFMIPAAIYLLSLYLLYGRLTLPQNLLVSLVPFAIAVFFIQKFI